MTFVTVTPFCSAMFCVLVVLRSVRVLSLLDTGADPTSGRPRLPRFAAGRLPYKTQNVPSGREKKRNRHRLQIKPRSCT